MSITTDRLASLIQRELAPIVNTQVKDKSFGYINLTEVKVTKDLSFANIYYTILSDDEKILERAKNALEEAKVSIRMELAKKIKKYKKNSRSFLNTMKRLPMAIALIVYLRQ